MLALAADAGFCGDWGVEHATFAEQDSGRQRRGGVSVSSRSPQARRACAATFGGFTRMKSWNIRVFQLPRWVRLCLWGALASTLTVCVGYNMIGFGSFLWWLGEGGEIATVAVIILLHAAAAGFAVRLWFEFFRAWKTGVLQ